MNYEPTNTEIITNKKEFFDIISSSNPGIYLIKPRILLSLVEEKFGIPTKLELQFPSSEIGSITLLEAAMLVALGKLVDAKTIFEFGTFLGYSTSLFSQNFPNSTVYSLDLPLSESELNSFSEITKADAMSNDVLNDNYLKALQASHGSIYLTNDGTAHRDVRLLKENSLDFQCGDLNLIESVDLVFIDGGHEEKIIESDTKNADAMRSQKSVVVWHDFNSNIHGDVTDYLEIHRDKRQMFHIQSTLLCFSIKF